MMNRMIICLFCLSVFWGYDNTNLDLATQAGRKGIYEKGVKLPKKAHETLKTLIERVSGLEKWAVDISC